MGMEVNGIIDIVFNYVGCLVFINIYVVYQFGGYILKRKVLVIVCSKGVMVVKFILCLGYIMNDGVVVFYVKVVWVVGVGKLFNGNIW